MAAKKKQAKHAAAKAAAAAAMAAEVNCRNSKPGNCAESPDELGDAVTVWVKKWRDWWTESQDVLDDCPDIDVDPPNINYSVCRALRAIHIDWCCWAEVLRKTQKACCPGPSGHIPPPPPPPF